MSAVKETYPPQLMDRVLRDRHICRVFFSSPFLGLEEERLLLTKRLPRLSQLCREQGVELTVVDMRWGISSESASEARTAYMCLTELDRSDIFVGFFAQRYGWHGVNDQALQDNYNLASEKWPWIEDYRDRSITEMEYLSGHLLNPGKMPAMFCFRDQEFDAAMMHKFPDKGNSYLAESDHAKQMLDNLKKRCLDTNDLCIARVLESYKTPEEMANHTFESLYSYIRDVLLPNTAKQKGEELTDPHDVFRISRCRMYEGGKNVDLLDNMVKETNRIVIHGATGCGKSALVSNWLKTKLSEQTVEANEVNDSQKESAESKKNCFIYHTVGGASSSARVIQLLERLMTKLVEIDESLEPSKKPVEMDDHVLAMNNMILRLGQSPRKVVIIVDGVDKLMKATKAQKPLFWLPVTLPNNVTIILTMITEASDLAIARDSLNYRELKIEPLSLDDKKALVLTILRDNSKELPPDEMTLVLDAAQTSNPLYLSIFMKELCTVDYYRKVGAKIQEMLESGDVTGLFTNFIQRLETDYCTSEYPTAVKDALSVIEVSKYGLRPAHLTALLDLPEAVWVPIQYSLLPYLLVTQDYLVYEYPELKSAIYKRYLENDEYRDAIKRRTADWMFRMHVKRRTQGVRQENLLLNSIELYYQLQDRTNIRGVFSDALSFQRMFEIDPFLCLQYWYSAELAGRRAGEFMSQAADRLLEESGNMNQVLAFLDKCVTFMASLMNYNAKEILLYKNQKCIRECPNMSDSERKERLDHIHYLLASLYSTMNKYDISVSLHERLLEKRRNSPEASTKVGKIRLGDSYHGLALEYSRLKKDPQMVLDMYYKANELYEDDEDKVLGTDHNIALVLLDMGRYEEGQVAFESVIERYDKKYFGEPPSEYGAFIMNLALVHRKQGHLDKAEELYSKAMEFNERLLGEDHMLVGKVLLNLVNVLMLKDKHEDALRVSERSLKIFRSSLDDDHDWCLYAIENTADCYRKLQRFDEALPLFWRAFDIRIANNSVQYGLKGLYDAMIDYHINNGLYVETAKLITILHDHFENAKYYGALAICDNNISPKPERDAKFSLDSGIERYPTEIFNLLYKFKYDIMLTEDVTLDHVMNFCKRYHPNFGSDGSFLLSVATWLVDDYNRFDWAAEVLLYTTEIFTNEYNITDLLVRVFQHYASQENKDYVIMIPLIRRILVLTPPSVGNYMSCCKICAMGARADLCRQYAAEMEEKWAEDEEVVKFVGVMRNLCQDMDVAMKEEDVKDSDQ